MHLRTWFGSIFITTRLIASSQLRLGILPILNENDVMSTRKTPLRDERGAIFWDNDSLSALVGAEIGADVIVLLSDVGPHHLP